MIDDVEGSDFINASFIEVNGFKLVSNFEQNFVSIQHIIHIENNNDEKSDVMSILFPNINTKQIINPNAYDLIIAINFSLDKKPAE